MSRTDDVLAAIDHAVRDCAVSDDAMRWQPEPPALASHDQELQDLNSELAAAAGNPRYGLRTECTTGEIRAWAEATYQHLFYEDITLYEPLSVIQSGRQTGPCLGCGGPTYGPPAALIVNEEPGTGTVTATFFPCRCVLSVRDEPILRYRACPHQTRNT